MTKLTIAERAVVIAFFCLALFSVVMLGAVFGYLVAGPSAALYCPADECGWLTALRAYFGCISALVAGAMTMNSATLKKLTGGTK